MKKIYDRIVNIFKHLGGDTDVHTTPSDIHADVLEQYKIANKKIKIDNQPFRLSGLLHILTNKISNNLKYHRHKLYYDIDKEVARYIVGDNDYIEQILKPLLDQLIILNSDSRIVLHISKEENRFIVFDLYNPDAVMSRALCKILKNKKAPKEEHMGTLKLFTKARNIAEAMGGSLDVECSKRNGTHFIFKLPYIEDKNARSNKYRLKNVLSGEKALFIGNTKYETEKVAYILEHFEVQTETITLEEFNTKKPDLDKYLMVVLRSSDFSSKHMIFFRTLQQNQKKNFKLITIHDLFEEESKVEMAKSIADAELYCPIIIGDVEEILYQIFILKSKAVKGVSNKKAFNPTRFVIKGDKPLEKKDMERFRGAHIAVAEDSKIDQRILRHILDIEGVRVFIVSNGKELIELLEKEEIDMVFTDVNMPVMDGLTATKAIRSMPKWKNLPIISISSMSFGHEIQAMEVAGMDAAIPKPISARNIYTALEKYLKVSPATQVKHTKRKKKQQTDLSDYKGNPAILDVKKGIAETESKLAYMELLNETMETLEDSEEEFKKLIFRGEYIALKAFVRSMVRLYSNIHATEMAEMFEEIMLYLSTNNSKKHLPDYIILFAKNKKRLQKEIEAYRSYISEVWLEAV